VSSRRQSTANVRWRDGHRKRHLGCWAGARVARQLESAGLALENLRLDLLKLRSSGVQAAIHDVQSATQEARALSREIGHVLEAAEEVRGSSAI
jgi:hypothetical protein